MNSLEFIEDEIKIIKKKIKELKEEEDLHWNYEHEDEAIECGFQIEEYEDILKILQQIKEELEAWEVCKEDSVIYSILKDFSKGKSINYHKLPEKQQEKLKKALEVKDDK